MKRVKLLARGTAAYMEHKEVCKNFIYLFILFHNVLSMPSKNLIAFFLDHSHSKKSKESWKLPQKISVEYSHTSSSANDVLQEVYFLPSH